MKRRPEQLSMLTLMRAPDMERVVRRLVPQGQLMKVGATYNSEGLILSLTTEVITDAEEVEAETARVQAREAGQGGLAVPPVPPWSEPLD